MKCIAQEGRSRFIMQETPESVDVHLLDIKRGTSTKLNIHNALRSGFWKPFDGDNQPELKKRLEAILEEEGIDPKTLAKRALDRLTRAFDPDQARDEKGMWSSEGGSGASGGESKQASSSTSSGVLQSDIPEPLRFEDSILTVDIGNVAQVKDVLSQGTKETSEIVGRLGEVADRYKEIPKLQDEIDKATTEGTKLIIEGAKMDDERLDKLGKHIEELSHQRATLDAKMRTEMMSILSANPSGEGKPAITYGVYGEPDRVHEMGLSEAGQFYHHMAAPGAYEPGSPEVSIDRSFSRSATNALDGSIVLGNVKSGGEAAMHMIHETAHWLEYNNPEIGEASLAFLRMRTQGEKPVKLSDIDPGFDPSEYALPDKFSKPYVGKIYIRAPGMKGIGTEVLSTGVEMLWREPREFAKRDPEHFAFVLSVLHGKFSKPKREKQKKAA